MGIVVRTPTKRYVFVHPKISNVATPGNIRRKSAE
jgi:hypothetical protein